MFFNKKIKELTEQINRMSEPATYDLKFSYREDLDIFSGPPIIEEKVGYNSSGFMRKTRRILSADEERLLRLSNVKIKKSK